MRGGKRRRFILYLSVWSAVKYAAIGVGAVLLILMLLQQRQQQQLLLLSTDDDDDDDDDCLFEWMTSVVGKLESFAHVVFLREKDR